MGIFQENLYDREGLWAGINSLESSARFVFYDGELLTETKEEGDLQSRYVQGYGVAASEVNGEAGYHAFHLDEQNSTVYITGNQRQVENAYAYDAFGNLRGQAGELLNRILYTGQQYDQEMGQYYLRARYYNPVVGRFTQEDVYRGDGLNLYAYCRNNPVIYYDPSGYASSLDPTTYTDPSSLSGLSAGQKKSTPGIVTGAFTSSMPVVGNTIRSSDYTTIAIPQEVAQQLVGKQVSSFDELRGEIYKGISNSSYADEFSASNQTLMADGLAPYAPESLQTGNNYNQEKYNIHHVNPVEDGGDVYNLDNLAIVAPQAHDEIHAEIDAEKKEKKEEESCKG